MADDRVYTIFDVGNHVMRYGIAGDDAPRNVERSVYVKDEQGSLATFGDAALYSDIEPERLVEDSVCKDIDGISMFGSHLNDYIGLAPQGVLYSLNLAMPLTGKLALIESHFELTGQTAVSLTSTTCLTMYSTGRTTGLALNLGHDGCEIGALFEGSLIGSYTRFLPIGGRKISEQLFSSLHESYPELFDRPTLRKIAIVEDIKAKMCRVSMHAQTPQASPQSFILPDEQRIIEVTPEAVRVPDMYFEPAGFGQPCKNLLQLVESSLDSEVHDLWIEELNKVLVLTGGSSMHPDLPERLEQSIQQSSSFKPRIRVVATMERKYSSWIGGSILASLSSFGNIVVSREHYQEQGAHQVYRKSCAATFCH